MWRYCPICRTGRTLWRGRMKGEPMNQDNKLDIKEAFRKYAQKELEFYQNAEKNKLYQRILPNMKDRTKGVIDLFYNGIIVGGYIDTETNTVVLNKLSLAKKKKCQKRLS